MNHEEIMKKYEEMSMTDKIRSSRKLFLAVLIIVLATALCGFGAIEGGQWVTAVTFGSGIYTGANVAQKKIRGGNKN